MTTDEVLRKATRAWRRLGVASQDIAAMSRELNADLRSAAADGRSADDYVVATRQGSLAAGRRPAGSCKDGDG